MTRMRNSSAFEMPVHEERTRLIDDEDDHRPNDRANNRANNRADNANNVKTPAQLKQKIKEIVNHRARVMCLSETFNLNFAQQAPENFWKELCGNLGELSIVLDESKKRQFISLYESETDKEFEQSIESSDRIPALTFRSGTSMIKSHSLHYKFSKKGNKVHVSGFANCVEVDLSYEWFYKKWKSDTILGFIEQHVEYFSRNRLNPIY